MDDDEKALVAEVVIRQAAGRVPVLIGTGAEDTREVVRLSRRAEKLGADGVMIIPPFYSTPTDDELVHHYKTVADAIALPIMEAVYKHYGDFTALDQVDLKVAKGEKIVVCGPSGSGKSTLIRCINHIEKHDEGLIYVNGVELDRQRKNIDAVRRDTGMSYGGYEARVGTPKLLELLDQLDLKATFFVTGWSVDAHPAMAESILKAGHDLPRLDRRRRADDPRCPRAGVESVCRNLPAIPVPHRRRSRQAGRGRRQMDV